MSRPARFYRSLWLGLQPWHPTPVVDDLPPRVRAIIIATAERYSVTPDAILARHGPQVVQQAKCEAVRRIRAEISISGRPPSFLKIGAWFGRTHAAVLRMSKAVYPQAGSFPVEGDPSGNDTLANTAILPA